MSFIGDIIYAFKVRRLSRRAVYEMSGVSPRTDRMLIGEVVKRYGPYRLHKLDLALRSGRIVNSGKYFVVTGEISVPLTIEMRAERTDTRGYQMIVKRRKGPLRDCVHIGNIPIYRSSERDVYARADYLRKYRESVIPRYKEELRTTWDEAKGSGKRARQYRMTIAELQAEQRIMNEALETFISEYPDVAAAAKDNAVTAEREARRRTEWFFEMMNWLSKHAHW